MLSITFETSTSWSGTRIPTVSLDLVGEILGLSVACTLRVPTSLLPTLVVRVPHRTSQRPRSRRGSGFSSSHYPGEKPASSSISNLDSDLDSELSSDSDELLSEDDEEGEIPEGDSREGQTGWVYALSESTLLDMLKAVMRGASPLEVMLAVWSEAEETGAA